MEMMFRKYKRAICRDQEQSHCDTGRQGEPQNDKTGNNAKERPNECPASKNDTEFSHGRKNVTNPSPAEQSNAKEYVKEDNGGSIVQQRFSFDKDSQTLRRAKFLEQGNYSDRVSRRDQGAEEQAGRQGDRQKQPQAESDDRR